MGKGKPRKKKGGSLMGMRSGFKKAAGTGKKKRGKQADFITVLTWVFGVAFLVFLVWSLSR